MVHISFSGQERSGFTERLGRCDGCSPGMVLASFPREVTRRLHLPFELLSDEKLRFAKALRLPAFEVDGMKLIRRITLIERDGRIAKVFYPVFPFMIFSKCRV